MKSPILKEERDYNEENNDLAIGKEEKKTFKIVLYK